MDAEVRRAEPLDVRGVLGHRLGGDAVAVAPVPVDQLGRNGRGRGQLVDQAQPRVLAQGVGRQRDRGPDLGQFGGLLEHVGVVARDERGPGGRFTLPAARTRRRVAVEARPHAAGERIEAEIDHRRGEEREELGKDEPAHHRDPHIQPRTRAQP